MIEHAGDPEYSLLTRSSDGQMLFLANMLSKMKHDTQLGSRIAEVHNGSLAVHRRRRPGREQHPPLDHRERLARGDRRAAAEHVLQHRHRDLHLGAHATASPSTARGKVQLIDATKWFKPLRKNLGKQELRARPTTTSSGSATRSSPSRRPSSRRSSRTRPSATGRSPSSGRCGSTGIDPDRAYSPQGDQGAQGDRRARRGRAGRHQEDPQAGTPSPTRSAACSRRPIDGKPVRRRVRARQRPARHRAGAAARAGRHRGVHRARGAAATPRTPGSTRASVKIGYEISFTRYFYKPQPLRTLEEIRADILALERRPKACSARSSGERACDRRRSPAIRLTSDIAEPWLGKLPVGIWRGRLERNYGIQRQDDLQAREDARRATLEFTYLEAASFRVRTPVTPTASAIARSRRDVTQLKSERATSWFVRGLQSARRPSVGVSGPYRRACIIVGADHRVRHADLESHDYLTAAMSAA